MNDSQRVAVILPAAGASRRYTQAGGLRSKLDEDLGGKPVLQRTIELFTKHDLVSAIIVAGPHEDEAWTAFMEQHGDRMGLLGAKVCRGGVTHRYETVRNALGHVPEDATHIAVHDAARPCTPVDLIDRVFDAARRHGAAIPAVELGDTLKRVVQTDEADHGDDDPAAAILGLTPKAGAKLRVVERTVDRAGLVMVQTPQVFEAGLLRRAYEQSDLTSTDDAALIERMGERVAVVEGDVRNIKITRPGDIELARHIMGVRGPAERPVHKRF